MYYLQSVKILVEAEERRRFIALAEKLQKEGIRSDVADRQTEECLHTLWITDSSARAAELLREGKAVLAYLREENRAEDFSGVKYACEEPEELCAEYLEQVYRRYAGVPWDILKTERCSLRETTVEDVEAFYEIYREPSVTEYMEDLFEDPQKEKTYMEEYIQKIYGFYGFGVWTVLKKDTGEIIGRAGYSCREGFEDPELGFVIGVPWQRQGYGEEVCRAILKYGEEMLGFERIQALVKPGNEPSEKLLRKLGMRAEDTVFLQEKTYIRFLKDLHPDEKS
ncbi:MAG: GNAT family N-acetyltransferase [Lachnospiraceae bacterium]|nr:GNAT family N-acetyltransferase [Lachnospiraceae bacterium]